MADVLQPRARVVGSGHYLPPTVVTNEDLAQRMNTDPDWIQARTGIEARRHVDGTEGTADLAFHASQRALEDAQLQADDVDLIVFATLSPDHAFPGSGVLLGARLGIPGVPALDVRNQCSGFLYGLQCADAMIRAGLYRRVLLVGAEVQSTGLDYSDAGRHIAVLFGDGAGAVVLEATDAPTGGDGAGILHTTLGADGRQFQALWCPAPASGQYPSRITAEDLAQGRHYPQMNGRLVFKNAVRAMRDAALEVLEASGVALEDVALFLPHQANLRISELVCESLGVSPERFYNNIDQYGNTTAATLPISLDECRRAGRVLPGDLVVMMAFGAGFTWGAALIRM